MFSWLFEKKLTEEELFRARVLHLFGNLQQEMRDLGTFTQKLSDKLDKVIVYQDNIKEKVSPKARTYTISDIDSRKS